MNIANNRIFVDVTELSIFDKGTGIQRVTKAIFNSLSTRPPLDWQVVAVRGDGTLGKFVSVQHLNTQVNHADGEEIIEIQSEDIYLSLDLTYNISKNLNQELQNARNNGARIYFVVYDLIPLMYPEWFFGNNDWFEGNDYLDLFEHWFNCAVQSDGLICISKAVQDDVSAWIAIDKPANSAIPKLGFFHLGADIASSLTSKGLPINCKKIIQVIQSRKTFLMVGTIEPRKGHQLALEAVEKLWSEGVDVNLVFVGKQGWKVDALAERIKTHAKLSNQLFWLSDISDEYLRAIYQASSVLLALSDAEGFGLPLVEAAYYMLPIVARNIPVFKEICKGGAFYFDGSNNHDLYVDLKKWLYQYEQNTHPKSNEIQVLSWAESTSQLLTVLENMSGISFSWNANEQ